MIYDTNWAVEFKALYQDKTENTLYRGLTVDVKNQTEYFFIIISTT